MSIATAILVALCLASWGLTVRMYVKIREARSEVLKLGAVWELKRNEVLKKIEEKGKDATFDDLADLVDRNLFG